MYGMGALGFLGLGCWVGCQAWCGGLWVNICWLDIALCALFCGLVLYYCAPSVYVQPLSCFTCVVLSLLCLSSLRDGILVTKSVCCSSILHLCLCFPL